MANIIIDENGNSMMLSELLVEADVQRFESQEDLQRKLGPVCEAESSARQTGSSGSSRRRSWAEMNKLRALSWGGGGLVVLLAAWAAVHYGDAVRFAPAILIGVIAAGLPFGLAYSKSAVESLRLRLADTDGGFQRRTGFGVRLHVRRRRLARLPGGSAFGAPGRRGGVRTRWNVTPSRRGRG